MVVNTGDTVAADARLGVVTCRVRHVLADRRAAARRCRSPAGRCQRTVNTGPPVELDTIRPADESTYAAIVRLVEAAQGSKAPFVRMADRYALVPGRHGCTRRRRVAGLAEIRCARVAVLVVATPCPLILAAPVALVSGCRARRAPA